MVSRMCFSGLLVLSLAAAALSEPIELRPKPGADQAYSYRVGIDIDVTQRMGDEAEPTMDTAKHEALLAFRIESINEDQSATVAVAIQAVRFQVEGVSGSGSFIGATDPTTLEGFAGQQAGSSDDVIKSLGEALLSCSPRLRVMPDGSVTDVTGFEPFLRAYGGQEQYDERVLSFFAPQKFALMIEPIFTADGAGTRSLDVGKGWQMVESVSLGAAGTFDMVTNWSVSTAQGDDVVLRGSLLIEQLVPALRDASTPQVRLVEHDGTTTARWSNSRSQLLERESSQRISTEWILGDLRLQQTQVSSSRIRLVSGQTE